MIKWSLLLPLFLLLNGCVTSTTQTQQELADEASFKSREELLLSTNNSEKLIEFYKQSLREEESTEVRIKLVSAYVDVHDYESANFHVEQVVPDTNQKAQVLFLKAKIDFARGQTDKAFTNATRALEASPAFAEAENLLGLIWAEKGNYVKSREHFLKARSHFFDDVIIKNNLAVLDLIEKNYEAAIQKLQPLYEKGSEDPQVLSNLAFAYAKMGLYKPMEQVLREQNYSTEQIQQIYIALVKLKSKQEQGDLVHLNVVDKEKVREEVLLQTEEVKPEMADPSTEIALVDLDEPALEEQVVQDEKE